MDNTRQKLPGATSFSLRGRGSCAENERGGQKFGFLKLVQQGNRLFLTSSPEKQDYTLPQGPFLANNGSRESEALNLHHIKAKESLQGGRIPMDVKEIDGVSFTAIPGKKGKKEEMGGLDFQKLLQEAQSGRKSAEAVNSPNPQTGRAEFFADPVLPIPALNLRPELPEPSALRSQGTQAVEKALDLLDQYQRAIADPNLSLREINPLVQSLSKEVNGLAQWSEKLPSSDPLQAILTEIGVLSSLEVEKFNRGDYI